MDNKFLRLMHSLTIDVHRYSSIFKEKFEIQLDLPFGQLEGGSETIFQQMGVGVLGVSSLLLFIRLWLEGKSLFSCSGLVSQI